ncbi:hypothetical protein ACEPAF_6118 [Sanghuangporus sanghuang]
MKDLHATLDLVFTTVREKAPGAERHRDLMTLPDEILSYIINLACEDAWEQGDWLLGRNAMDRLVVNLSLVSRRFRNAVVNTASLWACIDNRYCLGTGFNERIARSKGLPLTLFIDFPKDDGERQKILSQIMPIKDRWQHFRGYTMDSITAKELPVAEFSKVESLDLSFTGREQLDSSDSLFTKWAFPNTTLLRITNATPPPGLFPKVITCIFSYYAVEELMLGVGGFPHGGLLQMLVSMPQLKHLSVYFIGWSVSSPIALVPVTLPSVSTVTLGHKTFISPSRGSVSHLRWILESLILPNVKDLHLHLNFAEADQVLSWVRLITPASERLRQVTSLTIEGHSHLSHNVIYPLIVLFRNIRTLELKAYNIPKTLRGLEQNLELDQLRVFVPREPYTSKPVHIERGDLDMLTRYPDDVRIA